MSRDLVASAPAAHRLSRRLFLASLAAGGASLVMGFSVVDPRWKKRRRHRAPELAPNLWVRIDASGDVHIRVHKTEMGQGVLTALPMLIVEELGSDWSRVRVEQADVDFCFADQNTSGSSSIIDTWTALRVAGAATRQVLARAAARRWSVPAEECEAENGWIVHPGTGRRASFGDLVPDAVDIAPPNAKDVRLKAPSAYRLVGKPTRRLDTPAKITGEQVYGMDLKLPDMLYATVIRCPVSGGTLERVDDRRTLAVPGVRRVVVLDADPPSRLPQRVAVIADSTWAALQGRRALDVEWNEGPNASLSSNTIRAGLRSAEAGAPVVVRNDGDALAAGVLDAGATSARYEVPFLAHAPMEPLNCTAHVRGDVIELWAPTQFPQRAAEHVSRLTGLPKEAIRIHVVPMGGGFGRRVYPDLPVEAVQVARAVEAPVKVVWTREDDIRQDFFRPVSLQRLSATLNGDGRPRAWLHSLTGPSIARSVFGNARPAEDSEVDGAVSIPYAIPHVRVEYHLADLPIPLGVWRSVSQSQNVFAVESFIDELAHCAAADPVGYRLALLGKEPRLRHVLERAAELADWGRALPAGRGRGVAVNLYYRTFLAQVVEVSVDARQRIRADRVVCAIDCGQVVNPLTVQAQVEGAVAWALSAALKGRITLRNGRIEQSNFHDYQVLRLPEMPRVDVHIVESAEEPGGIGEPAVPPVAPAVANAVFVATGRRLRELPFGLHHARA
jgi:isoquinoline 1-oxidoreductase subunit beta